MSYNLNDAKDIMTAIRRLNHDVMAKEHGKDSKASPSVVALVKCHEDAARYLREFMACVGKMPELMNRVCEQACIKDKEGNVSGPKPIAAMDYMVAISDVQSLSGELANAFIASEYEAMEFGDRNNMVMSCCNNK